MKIVRELEIFIRTAKTGSLSEAARLLDLTPAATSAAVKRLEEELKTTLFVRSTRSLRLTPAGQLFLDQCEPAVQMIMDACQAAQSGDTVLRGILQISLPSDFGRNIVLPWLDEFQNQYPQIKLRVAMSDRLADLFREQVDLALRYGSLPDSNMVALSIAPNNRRILCAAPSYLDRRGIPSTLEDLANHNCLCFMLGEYVYDHWRFDLNGQEVSIQVQGDRVSLDGDAVRRWALAGFGIAYKSQLDVAEDIRCGRLIQVCPEWLGEAAPLNLLCANRRQVSPVVQALQLFLQQKCVELIQT
ncbi:LysR family transcriptional regulator [Deefgea tanakiae]|uniref:LysR family transcriptional regulator n=1 Tax=Deefgea tanakiae TaxID=2865840 RepID=A0ABX8ZDM0_9NEIS|nr:LysR family transcriptional regulator [Deefgea tanakiae]QZA79245.1 LysR family transcriptional regulator [Deefgea tanakiae]